VPLAPPADQQSEGGKWIEHATVAQQSLTAWIEGKPPQEIDLLLSRIPLRSAFRGLRLSLKSLMTAPKDPAEVKGLPNSASQSLAQLVKAERNGPGALLPFLASQTGTLPADEVKSACLNLLPHAPDRLRQFESTFGRLSEFDKNRVLALAAEVGNSWERAEQRWRVAAQSVEHAADTEARLSDKTLIDVE
jgi:hypothetical protein